MKIKIVEPGWAGFSGQFGAVEFADGVSIEDVSAAEARTLAGLVQIETLEGKNPSATQQLLDAHHNAPRQVEPLKHIPEAPPAPAAAKVWTQDELAAVADASGIKGIREIADPLGLKDNSIAELMAKILANQAK